MQRYGRYSWTCPHCKKLFEKDTPQGLGLAKENHLRTHRVPIHTVEYIPRDYEQYPEGICGEMQGSCMNCPLPENMRGDCIAAQSNNPGIDTGRKPQ